MEVEEDFPAEEDIIWEEGDGISREVEADSAVVEEVLVVVVASAALEEDLPEVVEQVEVGKGYATKGSTN